MDEDDFQAFLEASNEDEESLTMKRSYKAPRGGGSGMGDSMHRSSGGMSMSSSYGNMSAMGMGGMGGRYGRDPYDMDLPAARPAPKVAKKKEPQVRASMYGDSTLDRSTSLLRQSRQSDKVEKKEEPTAKKSAGKKAAPPEPVEPEHAELSDSESLSTSVPHAQDKDEKKASGISSFAGLLADFQQFEKEAADTVKQEEERAKREEEERIRQEAEAKRKRQEEEELAEQRRQEDEKRRKQEEEERKKKEAELEKKRQEDELKRKQEEKQKQEEEARKREEQRLKEEELKRQEAEAQRKKEQEEADRKKKEEDEAKNSEEEAKRKLEEFKRQMEEERNKKEEAERKQREEERKREEEERKREEEEQAKLDQLRKIEEEKKRNEEERIRQEREEALRHEERMRQEERSSKHLEPEKNLQGHSLRLDCVAKREYDSSPKTLLNGEERTKRHADEESNYDASFFDTGVSQEDPLEALRHRSSDDHGQSLKEDPLEALRHRSSDDHGQSLKDSDDVFLAGQPQQPRRNSHERRESSPQVANVEGELASRNAFVSASAGSGPLMASVRDSLGSVAFGSKPGNSMPRQDNASHDEDRLRWPCDLVLRSTSSGDLEEKQAFFRGLESSSLPHMSQLSGAPSFNITSAMLRDPKCRSEIMASVGLHQSGGAPTGQPSLESVGQEIHALRNKIAMLEQSNAQLSAERIQTEEKWARLDVDATWLRLENRKLEDEKKEKSALLRQATLSQHDLEKRLMLCERESAERLETAARDAAAAKQREEELLAHVAALEAKSAGLQEECDGLREDLVLAPAAIQQRIAPGTGSSEQGSETEVVKLRKELKMMEDMLRGCEKENANLAQQNKQLRQSARLRKEEVDDQQLKLVAELNAARASADTNPASMRRVSELERELVVAKERSDELAKELDRCREAKRQLERELLNGAPSAPSAEESQKLAQAVAGRSRAEAEITDLRDKIKWYVESQRDMDEDRQNAVRLGEEVRALRAENTELKRRPSAKETQRRATELQKQVDQLQECLRKRNPDSILNLMKACEPKPEEKKELRTLKGKVEELEARLSEREGTYDRQVRALRANYDRMRLEYERRAPGGDTGATEGTGVNGREEARRAGPDREAVLQARIHDLERQVEHTKSYYLSKLRKREPLVPPKPSRSVASNNAQHREMELQLQLKDRDERIEALTKELHWQTMDEATKSAPSTSDGSSAFLDNPSSLRLFLASPEASPIISLSTELRAMAHSARRRRYDEVASQAKSLVAVLAAEEAASGMLANSMPAEAAQHRNVLRLQAQPPLPASIWSAWRSLVEQLARVAAEASVRLEDGHPGSDSLQADVSSVLARICGCVDSVLFNLLFAPAGLSGYGNNKHPVQAWDPQPQLFLQSMLPRLFLEHVCEELHRAGPGQLVAALQDARVHADADARLRWSELGAVLSRTHGGHKLLGASKSAAHPDWTISLEELQQLVNADGGQRPPQTPCSSLLRTLTRIRLVALDHEPPLPLLFRSLDQGGHGFVSRAEFMEALRGVCCALSSEERCQLAVFFSPAMDPQFVCYPLLLQSIVPTRGEGICTEPHWPDNMIRPSPGRWAHAVPGVARAVAPNAAQIDALARKAELEAENTNLREQVRQLTERCAESAALAAQSPAHVARRLQGDMAALETRILEQQTSVSTGARKAEITLRGELDVCRHEVSSLRTALGFKEEEVERYKLELKAIIDELMVLKSITGDSA